MSKEKAVIILSGGMDSTVALHKTIENFGVENVKAISFNYQSKHNDQEYLRAERTCKNLGVEHHRVDLSNIADHLKSNLLKKGQDIPEGHYAEANMKKTVVPFRNGIMLSIACGIAASWGAEKVVIGNHAGDHAIYPDCRENFIENMSKAMEVGTYKGVSIYSPFCNVTKADIVTIGEKYNVDWKNTYSCYNGEEVQCGKCSTCFERREAFHLAGVEDPTKYQDKTNFLELKKAYDERLKAES